MLTKCRMIWCSAVRFVLLLQLRTIFHLIRTTSAFVHTQTHTHLSIWKRKIEKVSFYSSGYLQLCLFVCLCVQVRARIYSPKCNCKIDENMALNALLKYLTLTLWAEFYHWPFIHSLYLIRVLKHFIRKCIKDIARQLCCKCNRTGRLKRWEKDKKKETNKTKSFLSISPSLLSHSHTHLLHLSFLITLCARILYTKISVLCIYILFL